VLNEKEKKLIRRIDLNKGEIVHFLSKLVRSNSVNPPGDTTEIAGIVKEKLEECGSKCDLIRHDLDKPNVIARIGEREFPRILFNSHLDTVGTGELAMWKYDPFSAKIVDKRLYGRGSGDAKGSVSSMVIAATKILQEEIDLHGTLIVNMVSDEEVGGFKGTKYLIDKKLLNPDFAVIGEQTKNQIAIAEKGGVEFNVLVRGKTAHASTPWEGTNAISKMMRLLIEIEERLDKKISERHHPLTPPGSINIGLINGGFKVNVVPDKCEANIDRRFLPNESVDSVIKEFMDVIDEIKKGDQDLNVEVSVPFTASAISTSPNEKRVKIAQGVCKDLQIDSKFVGYNLGCDGRFFSELQIPTIIFGPGDPRLGHAPNESISIHDVITATKIYALLALRTLNIN